LFLSTAEKACHPSINIPIIHYSSLLVFLHPKKLKNKKKPPYIHVNNLSRTIVGVYIMSWCFIFTRRK
jgi:hypothetical protein